MSTSTLPAPLKHLAATVKDAHDEVTAARTRQDDAAHKRNLGVFILYHLYDQKKVAPLSRIAGINRVDLYKVLKKAPNVSRLKTTAQKMHITSLEEAKAVVKERVTQIGDFALEEEKARERRIRGVLQLAQARVDGEPLTKADIARETGLSATMVGTDLDEAAKRGYTPDQDMPDAGEERAETAGMIPLPAMADRLGVTVERLLERVAAVRLAGGEPEGMSRVGSRVLMADPNVFPAWWDRLRLGWVTLPEFAESSGVSYSYLLERLRTARKNGMEFASTDEYGGVDLYDPRQLGDWWDQYVGRDEAVSRGYDEAGRRNLAGMAALLGLTYDQAKTRVRTWQDRGDELPSHVVDAAGSRWFEPVEFAAKASGVEQLLGEPVSAVVPARAVRPLKEVGVESVRGLLYLGEQYLRTVPGLGPKLVAEIERKVREAGLIFK
ncbi:hypothetical protein ACWCSD_40420 [Nonomuraea sp. NPDC001684]